MEQNASDATKMISAKGDRKQLEVSTANSAAFVNTGEFIADTLLLSKTIFHAYDSFLINRMKR